MKITKDIEVTLDKKELSIIREMIDLGLDRLEEVDKQAWGEKYKDYKDFCNDFLIKTKI